MRRHQELALVSIQITRPMVMWPGIRWESEEVRFLGNLWGWGTTGVISAWEQGKMGYSKCVGSVNNAWQLDLRGRGG